MTIIEELIQWRAAIEAESKAKLAQIDKLIAIASSSTYSVSNHKILRFIASCETPIDADSLYNYVPIGGAQTALNELEAAGFLFKRSPTYTATQELHDFVAKIEISERKDQP